jgi:hypothetical protein
MYTFTVYVYDKETGKQVDEYELKADSAQEARAWAQDHRFDIEVY